MIGLAAASDAADTGTAAAGAIVLRRHAMTAQAPATTTNAAYPIVHRRDCSRSVNIGSTIVG